MILATFEEIRDKSPLFKNKKVALSSFLPNDSIYWAHLPAKDSNVKEETLSEHLDLVMTYFLRIVKENHLDEVIDNLIEKIAKNDDIELGRSVKTLFFNAILYHDFGKINHLFQENRMKNFNPKIKKIAHGFEHQHSALGAYLFVIHNLSEEGNELLD